MAGADQLHQENPQTLVVIEWHDGDEFEFTQSTERINYYGITGFPTAVFDGVEQFVGGYTPTSYPYYVPIFEGRIGTPSNYTIDLEIGETDGTNFDVTVTVEILEGNTTEALSLLMVLTETDVPAIGAENQNFVARAVYPDLNGTPIDFSTQTTQTVTQTVTVEDTYVYENCEIVVFLQNLTTREIYQGTSKMMTEITGIEEPAILDEISIYPNPAHGVVNINSSSQIHKVSVFNPSGQLVFKGNANSNLYHFSGQQLNPGLYLFRVETEAGITTQRIVIE